MTKSQTRKTGSKYLWAFSGGLGALLLDQTFFIYYAVMRAPGCTSDQAQTVGKTLSIGQAMYKDICCRWR
ncbi:MAG: hypothetical protein IPQ00_18050 [Chloracidobacterium sp.]|nr:hypothetical protein [Chloracidobacterium sp.]